MAIRSAEAEWRGNLAQGTGSVRSETGALAGAYSFGSRFESAEGTNPEELVAAAHASCFSMALSNGLAKAGFTPTSVRTVARVHLEKGEDGFSVTRIALECVAEVPGLESEAFQLHANEAKTGCPISRALAAVPIELHARLA